MSPSNFFFWSCIAFIFGIGLASWLSVPGWLSLIIVTGGIIILVIFWDSYNLALIGSCLVLGALGIFLFSSQQQLAPNHISKYNDTETVTFFGKVAAPPELRSSNTKLEIEAREVNDSSASGLVLLSVPRYPRYEYGDELKVTGQLQTPAEFEDFSYKDYLARYDIHSVVYFADVEKLSDGKANLVWRLKDSLKHSLQKFLPEPESGFAQRLFLGERRAMSETVLEDFKKTGTMHIVAISGYHVTIVSSLLLLLTRPLGRRFSFVLAVSAIFFYALLTGASASVVRASVMGFLVLLAMQFGRVSSLRNSITLTAALMLLFNPLLLRYDIGFQLSFLAVIGIVYISPWLEKVFAWLPGVFAFRDSVVITMSAMITTLPLSLYHFGRLALISPLVNFVLLPSIPLDMGLAFLTAAGGIVSDQLGQLLALPTWLSFYYGTQVVSWGAKIPGAYFDLEKIGWGWLAIMYVGIGVLLFYLNQKGNLKKSKI